MTKRYENVKSAELLDLMPVDDFRLVHEEQRKTVKGYSEIPVILDLKKAFAKTLNFKVPWDNELYGFLKCKKDLFAKTGYDNTAKITVSDWDDKIILIFEGTDGSEGPVYQIEKEYLKTLLDGCRKPEKLC